MVIFSRRAAVNDLFQTVLTTLVDEIFGIAGGGLFLLSWVLQAAESKRANTPVVSMSFFVIRSVGCVLLAIESLRSGSYSLFVVTVGTLFLNLYNIALFKKSAAKSAGSA